MSVGAYPLALHAQAKIAVIDDDADIASAIGVMLSAMTAFVDVFTSARDFLAKTESAGVTYDLLVCDWSMPELDGIALMRNLRSGVGDCYKAMTNMPVLFLTSRFSEAEIVEALAAGADDFLIKPVSGHMLRARAHAILRRQHWTTSIKPVGSTCQMHGFGFNSVDNSVVFESQHGRESVALSQKEFLLAKLLFENPGKVFSRDSLAEKIWQINPVAADTRTINSHVHMVRRKLRLSNGTNAVDDTNRVAISQVYGVGYVLSLSHEPHNIYPR